MEDIFTNLLEEHARIRRSLSAMSCLLGEAEGVGWDDQKDLELQRLKEMERQFSIMLKAHERKEEDCLSEVIRSMLGEGSPSLKALEAERKSIGEIFQLLQSVTSLCDGKHVYALRSVMSRVAEYLERHMAYEEQELFPLLKTRLCAREGP